MNYLTQSLSAPWHLLRIAYLIIGAMLIVQAVQTRDVTFALVGGIFLFQSVFNTGCCGVTKIFPDSPSKVQHSLEETDYTEIK